MLARQPRVNELAREIDHRAFEAIALRRLVAGDLRLARSITRIAVDLERAGDERKQLTRIGMRLHVAASAEPLEGVAAQLQHLADTAAAMLGDALRGLDQVKIGLAESVVAQDRELDRESRVRCACC